MVRYLNGLQSSNCIFGNRKRGKQLQGDYGFEEERHFIITLHNMADNDMNHIISLLQNASVIDVYNGKTADEYLAFVESPLKAFVEMMKIKQNREQLDSAEWAVCEKIVQTITYLITKERIVLPNLFDACADVFRCLRNAAAEVSSNQRAIMSSSIFKNIASVVKHLTMLHCIEHTNSERATISLRCGLQLLGNLTSLENETKNIIWEILYTDLQIFRKLLNSHDYKIQAYTSMVFYSCLTSQHRIKVINDNCDIIRDLTSIILKVDTEWSLFALEEFLLDEKFWEKCYENFQTNEKLLLLEIVAQIQDRQDNKFPEAVIIAISNYFKLKVSDIVRMDLYNLDNMKPLEIQALLLMLCKATVFSEYCVLKSDRDLLKTALDILKTVHILGKMENGPFSPVENFIDCEQFQECVESTPSYGFRRDLIRLIGNLCADCLENQNLVREMDGIPLLLDCCRIDMRNPFISEWSIFAIRNLLHKNLENQKVVAGITVHGDVVESDLLKQLRLQASNKDGKIILASLDEEDNMPS